MILQEYPAHSTDQTFFYCMLSSAGCNGSLSPPVTYPKQGLLFCGPTLPSHTYTISYTLPPACILLNPICSSFLSSYILVFFFVPQPKPTPICLLSIADSRSYEKQSLPSLSFQVWIVKLYSRVLAPLHSARHHLVLNVDIST